MNKIMNLFKDIVYQILNITTSDVVKFYFLRRLFYNLINGFERESEGDCGGCD